MKKIPIIISLLLITTLAIGTSFLQIRKLGGQNTRSNPYEIQDYEASDISNFTLDKAGSITERDLFQRYNTTSIGVISLTNIYKFYKTSDTGYMICAGGTNLYNATAGVLNDISVSASSVIANSQWSFETFTDGTNELVFAANNNIPLKSWNGTSATFTEEDGQYGSNCNILKKHKARLWAAGSKSLPYRIYYSSLNNGDDWNTTGGSFDLPDYEKIMALETMGDVLYVFTRQAIYAIVGDTPNEFYILKTASRVGTHAFKSVTLGGRLIFFLNKSGVFAFDGTESVNISEPIQPTIDTLSDTYIGDAAGLYDKRGRYWLSYTSQNGTFNDTILVYDTVIKQWYKLDNVNFSSFFKCEGGADKGELFAGCSNPVGYLWQLQRGSGTESIVHSTYDQLYSDVTFNTIVTKSPSVQLPYGIDTYDKLLLHCNGSDASTNFIDSSFGNKTITAFNNAQLDTAQLKFGTASSLFDGAGDFLRTPDSGDWTFGTGDFTVDFWVRFNAIVESPFVTQYVDNDNRWNIYYSSATNRLIAYWRNGATDMLQFYASWTPVVNTWYHITVARGSGTCYMFINGVSQSVNLGAGAYTANLSDIGAGNLYISENGASTAWVNGWMDEIRISKGIARWTNDFEPSYLEYKNSTSGTLTSQNLQINASGQSSLGTITWNETLPSDTDIQFTTRTGVTDDSVYWNGWQTWVSTHTVTLNTVSSPTVWTAQQAAVFTAQAPQNPQSRNINFYESWDTVSPACVQFNVSRGSVSTNRFCDIVVPVVNLSSDKFIGYWLKSPCTGNSIKLDIGEVSGTSVGYITANTVVPNVWEYHYWPLTYTSTDIDNIKWMRITYLGDTQGELYLGEVDAYDFLDSGDTISSTPDNFIQYKAILGSNNYGMTPELIKSNNYVITLSYTSAGGTAEDTLTSYWKSKIFDCGNIYNKLWQWLEVDLKSENPTTNHTVKLNYWLDDIEKTELTANVKVTGTTTKVRFYLPTGSRGKTFQFQVKDDILLDNLQVNSINIAYIQEGGN